LSVDVSRYKGLFLSEAAEHLRKLDGGIVTLERDPSDAATLEEVFRSAHSIKGMAGAMGYGEIQTIAHALEDLLSGMRQGRRLRTGTTDVLLMGVDAIRGMLTCIADDKPSVVELGPLLERIRRLARNGEAALPPAVEPGPAASRTPAVAPAPTPPASEAPGRRPWILRAEVAPSCATPAVRAFIVYRRAAALGEVARVEPPLELIKAGDFRGALTIELRSVLEAEEIRRVLRSIPELTSFDVREPAGVALRGAEAPASVMPRAPGALPVAPRAPAPLEAHRAAATVRVRTELLDRFMDSVADLLLAKARLQATAARFADREMEEVLGLVERAVREVHDRVMEVRLLPVATLTDRLPRMVRDLAVRRGKRVRLEISGTDVELDRAVIEALDTPLVHVVRNAVDHGIEEPELRVGAGKGADGLVRVGARRERDEVVVEVADDGRGIDPERLRKVVVERGILPEERVRELDDREALRLICLPGVSTATEVSEVSGRGVGMDVVQNVLESLGGNLEIASEVGVGTHIAMRLPITVAVLNVLAVTARDQVYAFPVTKVERTALAPREQLRRSAGALYYVHDATAPVPVLRLDELLGFEPHAPLSSPLPLLLVQSEGGKAALAVDRFLGQREVVLRPLGKLLERIDGLSGVALLSDGRPTFLLDAARLCRGHVAAPPPMGEKGEPA
jgi:two-component system chemotaxis sensor kinase CheA